ncbi:MAG TPA: hypothetical protein VMH22_05445 [bacterium]|nr:hypothetical protein [bacterium]
MKRSLIAAVAVLLLLSGMTYAFQPRPHRRPRIISGPVLGRFGYHREPRWTGQYVENCLPPEFVPCRGWIPPGDIGYQYYGWGWRFGWGYGRYGGWSGKHEHRGWTRTAMNTVETRAVVTMVTAMAVAAAADSLHRARSIQAGATPA